MRTQKASINGMHCSACEKVVTKRISQIAGVESVQVDIESGQATIISENGISLDTIQKVLKDTHYSVISL